MPHLLSVFFLALLPIAPSTRDDAVRIGLFSLFKPRELVVRIVSGDGAMLDTNRIGGPRPLSPGDRLRFRLGGDQVEMTITDASSGMGRSATIAAAGIHGAAVIELSVPGKIRRAVRGDLTIEPAARREALKIILTTDRESAVASVVAAETEDRSPEALKALAVVARTFMLSHPNRHPGEGFDFCDTTHCQFYRGEADLALESTSPVVAAPVATAVATAVAATTGKTLLYEQKPIEAYFTASCGGMTVTPQMVWGGAPNYPYHRIACQWCRGSSHYSWTRTLSAKSVLGAVSAASGVEFSSATRVTLERDDQSGFVRTVIIGDTGRDTPPLKLSADEFRRAVGRRLGWNTILSPTFSLVRRGDQFVFRGRGFGSQVGLCLAGASAQARAGRSYDQILHFYFPQATIGSAGPDGTKNGAKDGGRSKEMTPKYKR